jgi:hypothetical protein
MGALQMHEISTPASQDAAGYQLLSDCKGNALAISRGKSYHPRDYLVCTIGLQLIDLDGMSMHRPLCMDLSKSVKDCGELDRGEPPRCVVQRRIAGAFTDAVPTDVE